jgi:hypothetical protein
MNATQLLAHCDRLAEAPNEEQAKLSACNVCMTYTAML